MIDDLRSAVVNCPESYIAEMFDGNWKTLSKFVDYMIMMTNAVRGTQSGNIEDTIQTVSGLNESGMTSWNRDSNSIVERRGFCGVCRQHVVLCDCDPIGPLNNIW